MGKRPVLLTPGAAANSLVGLTPLHVLTAALALISGLATKRHGVCVELATLLESCIADNG